MNIKHLVSMTLGIVAVASSIVFSNPAPAKAGIEGVGAIVGTMVQTATANQYCTGSDFVCGCKVDKSQKGILIPYPIMSEQDDKHSPFGCYVEILFRENMKYVATVAIIYIIYSGIQYMLSGPDANNLAKAKQRILGVLGGLIFFYLIQYVPRLLANNLSF